MTDEKIKRINFLAKKARESKLSEKELKEQQDLRREYIDSMRKNLECQLGNIVVVEKDGKRHKLEMKQ